jgi:hypothetical protein
LAWPTQSTVASQALVEALLKRCERAVCPFSSGGQNGHHLTTTSGPNSRPWSPTRPTDCSPPHRRPSGSSSPHSSAPACFPTRTPHRCRTAVRCCGCRMADRCCAPRRCHPIRRLWQRRGARDGGGACPSGRRCPCSACCSPSRPPRGHRPACRGKAKAFRSRVT